MAAENLHLIQVHWEGPYRIADLHNLKNEETDYGVYQIYGKHPVSRSYRLRDV